MRDTLTGVVVAALWIIFVLALWIGVQELSGSISKAWPQEDGLSVAPQVDNRWAAEGDSFDEAVRPAGSLENPYSIQDESGRQIGTLHERQPANMYAPAGTVANPYQFQPSR